MVKPLSNRKELKKGLYLVPTPIGNLGDITLRAIEILESSDFIICEDTRVTKNLLNKFEIKSKLISNHKFNEVKNLNKILNLLKDGRIISLVSDAGTPGISDPGAILVKECIKEKLNIIPLPGPSAVTLALTASGFSDRFIFYGFFPEKEKTLKHDLEVLVQLNCSIVFFISPKKINKIIPILKSYFSDRDILICREMTKFYEEFIRCKISDLIKFDLEPKGELTVVISENKINKKISHFLSESDKRIIAKMINNLSVREITSLISENSKASKKEIYNYCLSLKNEK